MPMFLILDNGTVLGISIIAPSVCEKRVTMANAPEECKNYTTDLENKNVGGI